MESHRSVVRSLYALFAFFFIQTLVLTIVFLNLPTPINTTVKEVGPAGKDAPVIIPKDGKDSISTVTLLKTERTIIDSVAAPLLPAKEALPCTTSNNETGDALFTCPGGSSSILSKPKDGKNGDVAQFLLEDCKLKYKYPADDEWITMGKVCEVQP